MQDAINSTVPVIQKAANIVVDSLNHVVPPDAQALMRVQSNIYGMDDKNGTNTTSLGIIIGAAVGGGAALLMLCGVGVYCCVKYFNRSSGEGLGSYFQATHDGSECDDTEGTVYFSSLPEGQTVGASTDITANTVEDGEKLPLIDNKKGSTPGEGRHTTPGQVDAWMQGTQNGDNMGLTIINESADSAGSGDEETSTGLIIESNQG